jgi:glycosyltransferase involved in cell wall biosynthesis
MNSYKLSILIPTLYSRMQKFTVLAEKIMYQIKENNLTQNIELIAHYDNKSIGLSKKRTDMLKNAQGDFITFLDDDDNIAPNYIESIYYTILKHPQTDVITFNQHCNVDGEKFVVKSDIKYDLTLQRTQKYNIFIRFPWIWCIWRRDLIVNIPFIDPDSNKKNYGEDLFWLSKVKNKIHTETKIDKILHFYRFDPNETETQNFN